MTYQQCIEFFYSQLPMYHRAGAAAMKTGLGNIKLLCERLGNPQHDFSAVHVAGTNGKGSSSHMLAAILQTAGYKTGLYTSPHLKDFRERIRINGLPINEDEVVAFVAKTHPLLDEIKPSFFELTVAMAFDYFAQQKVDIAIVEVGLGGRLDSTNIINPLVSVITNISIDHSNFLGNSLVSIAKEKAGIIKPGIPVIIGERDPETDQVFIQYAKKCNSDICFAQDRFSVKVLTQQSYMVMDIHEDGVLKWNELELQLGGPYQSRNIPGVLEAVHHLTRLGYVIADNQVSIGFNKVVDLTGIKGRWQILGENPKIICDTGHNRAAMEYIVQELQAIKQGRLHMVLGFVNDKDINSMLEILPQDAWYYFCSAKVPRSLAAEDLCKLADTFGLRGQVIIDTNNALASARKAAHKQDLIFVGGSTFVVAELRELN